MKRFNVWLFVFIFTGVSLMWAGGTKEKEEEVTETHVSENP